jgi:Ni,Fe-hydrogenase III small subunit/ferredoxin
MIRSLMARARQGHRTIGFPKDPAPPLPERFRGRPILDTSRCPDGCHACKEACPTSAILLSPDPMIDLGRCLFCTDCSEACPEGALRYLRETRLASTDREGLEVRAVAASPELASGPVASFTAVDPVNAGAPVTPTGRQDDFLPRVQALDRRMTRLFGRSLRLRQVSAGGCNGCEAEAAVLGTIVFDMGRFGIQFVASPRHADGLLITGPVTRNMSLALRKTWEAVPPPRIVIASGACAISGGPYAGHPETHDGAGSIVPVDLFVPGCPPHPLALLDGLLRLLGRMR